VYKIQTELKKCIISLRFRHGGEFIELLKSYNVEISMDGIGRCKDNIFEERTWRTLKYEWIFLRDYRSEEELRKLLGEFVKFFNK